METTVKVYRYNPQQDREGYYQSYHYQLEPGMSVLDVLNHLRACCDPSITYSYCCRNGHCGLCGANINGVPALACKQAASQDMVVEPLANLPVIRDLMIDREAYERLRPKLRLFLERECEGHHQLETIDMAQYEDFKIASRCIECYSCLSICPIYTKMPHSFIGPAALVLEGRHVFDPRDGQNRGLMLQSEGIDLCIGCGLCSTVCKVKAEPCETIRKLKQRC